MYFLALVVFVHCICLFFDCSNTPQAEFALAADRLLHILAEEGLAELRSNDEVEIVTPCGVYNGIKMTKDDDIFVVSILRAGDALMEVR